MSVEAILLHFETMFACEIRLIVQAFYVAVFKRKEVRGISLLNFFKLMFACEIRLIVQTVHVAVFKRVLKPPLKNEQLFRPLDRSHQAIASK